jgi:DNA-binding transcriptional MerR regulator
MNQFTIKDIENLSGIKAHTWRIWEQRYGLGIPQRKDSNHRFYDSDNLKQILRISYLYHHGLKISKIASLGEEQIKTITEDRLFTGNGYEYFVKELLEASIDLDEEKFERTFQDALNEMPVEDVIIHILYPFQNRVGLLWLTDHVIPAQEHFTSNIIRQKISVAIENLPIVKVSSKKVILLFTPEREHHELPLQFIYYLLRKNGNKVIYFGSNISLETIESYGQYKPFDYLLFHLITNLTNYNANDYLKEVSNRFADKKIAMSGTQVLQVSEVPANVRLLRSADEIRSFTEE